MYANGLLLSSYDDHIDVAAGCIDAYISSMYAPGIHLAPTSCDYFITLVIKVPTFVSVSDAMLHVTYNNSRPDIDKLYASIKKGIM